MWEKLRQNGKNSKYRRNEDTAYFGIWPLELLRIQSFSYTSDEIPPHRVIISDCNTESRWQEHYSCTFLLQRSQIAFWPELYFLFLSYFCIPIPSQKVLTLFSCFCIFLPFFRNQNVPPVAVYWEWAGTFMRSADKRACSKVWDYGQTLEPALHWTCGLWAGVAASTCAGLTVFPLFARTSLLLIRSGMLGV